MKAKHYAQGIFSCIIGFAICGALFLAGCIHSSPRNQSNYVRIEKVEVNPGGGAFTNGVTNITIGTAANDQMIDQGDESSGGQGNRVPITAQIPTQGSAIGDAAAQAALAVKGLVSGGKAEAKSGAASDCPDGNCGNCADGSCGVP